MSDQERPLANERWQRGLWMAAGFASLVVGLIGVVLPLLPTVPFVLLAAWCFSRGSARWERWLLNHKTFGPMIRRWRANHAIPLRAKQLATVMMAISAGGAFFVIAPPWNWAPAITCTLVALWMWRLPSA